MYLFKCILCFKEIEKDYERFFGPDVLALANLDFHVIHVYAASEYICRQCQEEKSFAAEPGSIAKIYENQLRPQV